MECTMRLTILAPSFIALAAAADGTRGGHCPPTGPALPPPRVAPSFDPLSLTQHLDSLLQNGTVPWNVSTTSFSIELTSSEHSFFEYHQTAALRDPRAVGQVDSNTVYRVASIAKVFNVLLLLLNAHEDLEAPVSRYVPELQGLEAYEGITLRMLASQLSGLPRDGRFNALATADRHELTNPGAIVDLFASQGDVLQMGGFPLPVPEAVPICDVVGGPLCTRAEFFDKLFSDGVVHPPGDQGAYSNQAFILLGWALENITGKPFDQLLTEQITGPLGLSSTGLVSPELSRASIPVGDASFIIDYDVGNLKPSAGLYSTTGDLSTFIRSIFRSTLLSSTLARSWLKPASFAGALSMSLGMPWEIIRLSGLTPDGRPIDMYSKLGDMPGYSTMMFLLPDYKVGGTIIVSGYDTYSIVTQLTDIVASKLVPALDVLARTQAKIYEGSYHSHSDGSANTTQGTLELRLDEGPGLKIAKWTNNGKPILHTLGGVRGIEADKMDARLYPVDGGNKWRMAIEQVRPDGLNPSLPSSACNSWLFVDMLRYAGKPVDEFDFDLREGVVIGVHNPGLRVTLKKHSV
ncbi:Beta-lactamase-like protein [Paramyrothecium foliicola]|nr:Beta-lactamase-like protein [Paramyrothecium foliicola]